MNNGKEMTPGSHRSLNFTRDFTDLLIHGAFKSPEFIWRPRVAYSAKFLRSHRATIFLSHMFVSTLALFVFGI